MELTFTREEIPKISRPGGSGREAEPWENHLAQLKDHTGDSFRVWTYDKQTGAISRMTNVRDRLRKAVPHENWHLAVRPLDADPNQFGVYVTYKGTFTPEQITDNARKHAERSARVKAARAKAATNGSTTEAEVTAPTAEPSAKERVKAAASRK